MSEDNSHTDFKNLTVEHAGSKITLPNTPRQMTLIEAENALRDKREELETDVDIWHEFECFPLDGLVAFHRALMSRYGQTIGQKTPPKSMLDVPRPPALINIEISATEQVQAALGSLKVPNVKGRLESQLPAGEDARPQFILAGNVLKKHEEEIEEINALTRKFLAENSIYKGKAIRVSFSWMREKRDFDARQDSPSFMDTRQTQTDSLIFPEHTMKLVNQGIFSAIKHIDAFRKNGVPLKRGVLLTGPYGCGKTLTASVTAKLCEDNGWTFLYLKDVNDLAVALKFARLYAPCCIFAEDIDQCSNQGRNPALNEILNTLDGVDYKDQEIITIVTTNHADQINKAMVRPGRLDTVIPVEPPDRDATERLINIYGKGLLDPNTDTSEAAHTLTGQIPSVIRECVERAKIIAIDREGNDEIRGKVTADDLRNAYEGMEPHLSLMDNGKDDGNGASALEFAMSTLGSAMGLSLGQVMHDSVPNFLRPMVPPDEVFSAMGAKAFSEWSQPGTAPASSSDNDNGNGDGEYPGT